jgi:hypothetical protein
MIAWWMKAIFIGAALIAVIVMYRCAATLLRRKEKSTTPPQAEGYKVGVQPKHSQQTAGNNAPSDSSQ